MENEKISVLMGIFNCAETLPAAIDCILAQTHTNWELILCDDGSSDATYDIALRYHDLHPSKIVLLKNTSNLGLNATLNRCLQAATGTFIARMDGDDLCAPERFEKELAVFSQEPEIAIVSSDMEFFDDTGVWGEIRHPTYPAKRDFVSGSPFCHAPCLVRKEAYDAVQGYTVDKKLLRVEDYHLWFKMYARGFAGKNLHEPLYQMRDDRNAFRRRKLRYRFNEAYVKYLVVSEFQLPIVCYIQVLKPILVGLLPSFLYRLLHKKHLQK